MSGKSQLAELKNQIEIVRSQICALLITIGELCEIFVEADIAKAQAESVIAAVDKAVEAMGTQN